MSQLKPSFSVLLLLFIVSSCSKSVDHDLLISDVNIVDVETGEIHVTQTVGIDGDKITAIYNTKVEPTENTQVINATGKYLIPGLWDMHIHYNVSYKEVAPLLIANGVTGVREMWGVPEKLNEIRTKMSAGELLAPDLYTAGAIIDGYPSRRRGSLEVKSTEEAIEATKGQMEEEIDFIKIYSSLSEEQFLAIAKTANDNNFPFAGHIPDAVSIYTAIDAGLASAEHLYGILEASSSKLDSLERLTDPMDKLNGLVDTFNEAKFDSLVSVLAKSDLWICPTLTVLNAVGQLDNEAFTTDERMDYLPNYITEIWNPAFYVRYPDKEKYYTTRKKVYQFQLGLMGKMSEAGVKILAGTDFANPHCYPGFSLHDELGLMVQGGMSELEVLKSATSHPAAFMGQAEHKGSVEVGKQASMVLLNKNPLEDIRNTQSIEAVIIRGEALNRAELDQILEETKAKAARKPYTLWLQENIPNKGIQASLEEMKRMIKSENPDYYFDDYSFFTLVDQYYPNGDWEIAKAILKTMTELEDVSANTYLYYGWLLIETGEFESANENLKEALKIQPELADAKHLMDSIAPLMKK